MLSISTSTCLLWYLATKFDGDYINKIINQSLDAW